jgi:hypothetical protein
VRGIADSTDAVEGTCDLIRSLLLLGWLVGCTSAEVPLRSGAGTGMSLSGGTELCAECSPVLDSLSSITDPLIGWGTVSFQPGQGREGVLLAPGAERHTFVEVAADFSAARLRGARGAGPGEFTGIRAVAPWRGDSLVILESTRAWVVGVDSLRGRFVQLPGRIQSFGVRTFQDSFLALDSYIPGSPIVAILGSDGRMVWRIDTLVSGATSASDDADFRRHFILPTASGELVILPMQRRFSVERWAPVTGSRQSQIVADWFVPWTDEARQAEFARPGTEPPLTLLLDAFVDNRGRLWLMGRVPDEQGIEAPDSLDGTRDWDGWADTVVEVWDLETEVRVAWARIDLLLGGFAGDGVVYRRTEDAGALPVISFHRLSWADQ